MQVGRRLDVDGDPVRPGAREVVHVSLGPLDHQMDIDEPAHRVNPLDDRVHGQRAERDRRDEMAVHDIDVDHPRPGSQDLVHL